MSVDRATIADGLRRLGLEERDTVFFHSSLKSLGRVEGGAETVVDAFVDVVGREGLVAVPTLSFTFAHKDPMGHLWDPAETPSRVGLITDTLWRRPDAHRSAHPTHSIAAIGARAADLVRDHEKGSTFDRQGPYGRYVQWDAWLLFLGVDFRVNTTVHAVEDWLDLPYMSNETALVKGPDGRPRCVPVTKSPMGHRDFYRTDSKLDEVLWSGGIVREGRVGAARVLMCRSKAQSRLLTEALAARPNLLLCDRSDCAFCSAWRQPTIDWIKGHPQVVEDVLSWLG
ncbi:MAG: AAC(3) family N-acetyltransferase [Armatimonadota bacterium]